MEYDSAFLSQALQHERQVVTLEQKLNGLLRNRKLPDVLKSQRERAELLHADESGLRREIEAAKRLAFNDRANIELLGRLFLDCLGACRAFPPTASGRRPGKSRQFKKTSPA